MFKRFLLALSLVGVFQTNCVGENGSGRPPAYLSNPNYSQCKPVCLVNNGSYKSLDMHCLSDCMYWAGKLGCTAN